MFPKKNYSNKEAIVIFSCFRYNFSIGIQTGRKFLSNNGTIKKEFFFRYFFRIKNGKQFKSIIKSPMFFQLQHDGNRHWKFAVQLVSHELQWNFAVKINWGIHFAIDWRQMAKKIVWSKNLNPFRISFPIQTIQSINDNF